MNNEVTLYSNEITANGIKMALLFNAIGIKPIYKEVALHKGGQRTKEYLALNPEGKIPTIVDNDFVLTESNAILHYIATKYESDLWPSNIKEQSEELKWLFWQSAIWAPAVSPFIHKRVVLPYFGASEIENISLEHLAVFKSAAKRLDNHLIDRKALVNDTITIADLSLASSLFFLEKAKIPLKDYSHITKWLNCLVQQNWWQATKDSKLHLLN